MIKEWTIASLIGAELLMLSSFASANEPAKQQSSDLRAEGESAIRALNVRWIASAQAKDLDKAISFYADDASFYPPGGPVAIGKEAIRKAWAELLATSGLDLRWSASKIEVAHSGDMALESGTFVLKMNNSEGKPVTMTGNYVVGWKKQQDRTWKVVADMAHPNP